MSETGIQPQRKRLLESLRGQLFWPLILGSLITFSMILWLAGPPVYRKLKNLRADQLVTNAEKAFALEKDMWAFQAAQSALSLRPADYRALKVLALVMARADSSQGLGLLLQLLENENTLEEDRARFEKQALRLALLFNRPEIAIGLLPHSNEAIASTDGEFSELVARYHQLYGNAGNAIPWIQRAIQLQEQSSEAVESSAQFKKRMELIRLALSQVISTGDTLEFKNLLWEPAFSRQPPNLEAIRLLTYSADLTDDDLLKLAEILETHPEAGFQDKLMAVDLRIRRNPQDQQRIIKDTLYRFGSSVGTDKQNAGPAFILDQNNKLQIEIATDATLEMELDRRIELARWLNRNGNGSQVAELFSMEEARQNQDVALILLDGLAENAQWAEIEALLSNERLKVPQLLKDLFLARTSRELGYKNAFQISWEPIEKAVIDRPKAYWYAAEYARVMGEFERADSLYRRLLEFPEVRWRSYLALIQLGEMKGDTQGLLDLLKKMSADYPSNITIKNDTAYLQGLLNTNLPEARRSAEELVNSRPEVPAHHVTLALCLIRAGQINEAERVLDDLELQWDQALPGWKSVRIHALKHSGRGQEADALKQNLNQEALKPEEIELLN